MTTPEPRDHAICDEQLLGGAIHPLLNRPLTSSDLHESALRIAQPLDFGNKNTQGHLHFRLGDERFLLPSRDIDSVTRPVIVRRIPHRTNHIVRGLCHLDGDLLICGSLRGLMQLSGPEPNPAEDSSQRMIVVGRRDRWVIHVDEVHGVVQIDSDTPVEPPLTVRDARQGLVNGLTHLNGQLTSVIETQRLISAFQGALA